jgi:hypothetical protein
LLLTHWFDLLGLLDVPTIIPFLLAYVDNRRLALIRLIDTRIQSAFGIRVRVSPEFLIEGRLKERGFSSLVSGKLDWVGEDADLGGGESGEGAASRDPEYDHLWGERLLKKEVRKNGVCRGN